MPIWPFKKRRRSVTEEKVRPQQQVARATTYPPLASTPTPPTAIPEDLSRRESGRQGPSTYDEKSEKREDQENIPPTSSPRRTSREEITALPMSRKLDSSPHLRPVDSSPVHIPYQFRPYTTSQTSIQRETNMSPAPRQPNKLRSRRSQVDSAAPSRKPSEKRRRDDRLREEEIRAMGARSPIPKRPGDGPLRSDSKKLRGHKNDSYISLPADDDVDSNMTGVAEQRGWQLGSFDMFNPRPAVRLSSHPQYIAPSSNPGPSPIAEMVRKDKEKMPASREKLKKRDTIGVRADGLDAGDLRVLMERDAKRREKKKQEQQEKLDRKLRNRNGRNRGDSDKKRREAEDARKAEVSRQEAEDASRGRALLTPPTDVHPALRDTAIEDTPQLVDLSTDEPAAQPIVPQAEKQYETPVEQPQDPFTDGAAAERSTTPPVETLPGAFSPVQTPMEDPVVETAREMSMTPPLSPVRTGATSSSLSQVAEARRASGLPTPPPIAEQRRQSDPKPDRRAGAWATFFRRGGTNLRKASDVPPSEGSFSNTSRESMRNQPLPAHLVDTQAQTRKQSNTPVRTMSKFREEIDMPVSPPDSRMPSPDVTTAAAAAAATRRRKGRVASPTVPEDHNMDDVQQHDTPMSPTTRSNRMLSMASVDSEASWLASGATNRNSTQSGVNRSIGSLNQRFTGSYEELDDAGALSRSSPRTKRSNLSSSLAALTGDVPDEESDEDGIADDLETPGDPMKMHESVRRQPTLIHRDPRVKSREGLLTEFAGGAETPEAEPEPNSAASGGSLYGFDDAPEEPEMKRASSIDYGRAGHVRHISSGSARLVGSPRSAKFGGIEEQPLPTSQPREV